MSENMETNETSEVRESTESQDAEGQRLDDATTTPEALVEETQSFQQAEAVEAAFTELVATSGSGDQIELPGREPTQVEGLILEPGVEIPGREESESEDGGEEHEDHWNEWPD